MALEEAGNKLKKKIEDHFIKDNLGIYLFWALKGGIHALLDLLSYISIPKVKEALMGTDKELTENLHAAVESKIAESLD